MERITGVNGKFLGYMTEDRVRGLIFTPGGQPLGYYQFSSNTTHTINGTLIGRGDQRMRLLPR